MRISTATLVLAALLAARSGWAQTSASATVSAFRDSVGTVQQPAAVEVWRSRLLSSATPSDRISLRVAVLERWLGMLTADREWLDRAWHRTAEIVRRDEDAAEAWYEMGLTKLALHDGGFAVKEGPYQQMGSDWLHGAADAFLRTLAVDSVHAPAAERLATTVLRQTIQPQLTDAIGPLRTAAAALPNDLDVQLSVGIVERELGHADSAAAVFTRYLAAGGDRGIGSLELARARFLAGDAAEAESLFYAGAAAASSIEAIALYRGDLAWIATPEELAAFDSVFVLGAADSISATARLRMVRRFWNDRELADGRGPGERIAEHYRRLAYARAHFRLVREARQESDSRGGNSPGANLRRMSGMRVIRSGGGMDVVPGSSVAGEDEPSIDMPLQALADRGNVPPREVYARLNSQTLLRAYQSGQRFVDDRGIIYVRHGEPADRAAFASPDLDPNESWKYVFPSGTLIFHFVGTTAPTTLVEQLDLSPALYASRSGLDPRYQRIAEGIGLGQSGITVRQTELQDVRDRGRDGIEIGTTTDSDPLHFDEALEPVVQAFGATDPAGNAGVIVVVFAVRGGRLDPVKVGPDSLIAYPINFRLIAQNEATGALVRLDTSRMFATRRVLGNAEYLTGQLAMRVGPGRYRLSAVLADSSGETGSLARRNSLHVPEVRAAELSMSDLVLGRTGSGQVWRAGAQQVPLNPLNTYSKDGEVQVFYQLGGLVAGKTYATTVEVGAPGRDAAVRVRFEETAESAETSVSRSIGLNRLDEGSYVLTVRLEDELGRVQAERSQMINVTD